MKYGKFIILDCTNNSFFISLVGCSYFTRNYFITISERKGIHDGNFLSHSRTFTDKRPFKGKKCLPLVDKYYIIGMQTTLKSQKNNLEEAELHDLTDMLCQFAGGAVTSFDCF